MKRLTVVVLLLMLLLPLEAKFSPSFTISGGYTNFRFTYHSMRTRADISLLSYRIGIVTLSIPVTVSHVSESTTNHYLVSPEHFKNGIGFEVMLSGEKWGGGCALYYGYEHFTDENAMMRYLELELSPLLRLEEHIALLLPLSYTYTPEGNEYSLSVALRIGGEL